jgi:tripartite-type tricarboxylate transporter receptor subunit TctC
MAKRSGAARYLILTILGWAAVPASNAVAADAVADFYQGKSITLVVGHEAGTGFDIYARALARYFGRHVPGSPKMVVQNMIGAGGLNAANWLYNIAPRDGTVIATFVQSVPFEPLYGNTAARFDAAKFGWIGNLEESIGICGVTKASGIATFDDLLKRETLFAGASTNGALARAALAVKNLLGARIRVVLGYPGSASAKLAMDRGEVAGICGLPLSTVTSFWKDDYQSGAFLPIIQLSGTRRPKLGPHVDDFAKSESDRQVIGLIFGTQALGRLFVTTPLVPKERVDALREAFTTTARDREFLDEAVKTQIDISPMTGAEVEAFIARVAASPPAAIERAKQAYRGD